MADSPYSALRARLVSRTVAHYLPPTFRVRAAADDSGERLRFDALLDLLPSHRAKYAPRPKTWLVTGARAAARAPPSSSTPSRSSTVRHPASSSTTAPSASWTCRG